MYKPFSRQFIADAQGFFLECAGKGYAGDLPKTTITELPKSKHYPFYKGRFLYTDTCHTRGLHSGGTTLLYYDYEPFWMMQYQGSAKSNDPKILALLKAALRATYCNGVWCAARGPQLYYDPDQFPGLIYINLGNTNDPDLRHWNPFNEKFTRFATLETICSEKGDWTPSIPNYTLDHYKKNAKKTIISSTIGSKGCCLAGFCKNCRLSVASADASSL